MGEYLLDHRRVFDAGNDPDRTTTFVAGLDDEKYVTEHAYDNPKFVEDMVRDVAAVLNRDDRIDAYVVESENFESIHNHSAYAMIKKDKTQD